MELGLAHVTGSPPGTRQCQMGASKPWNLELILEFIVLAILTILIIVHFSNFYTIHLINYYYVHM